MEQDEETSDSASLFHKELIIENFGPETSIEELTKCFRVALNQCSFKTRPQIKLATDRKGRQLGYATVTVPITKVDVFLNFDGWYINKHQLRVSLMESRNTRTTWHTTQTGVYTTSQSWLSPIHAPHKLHLCGLIDGGVFLTNPRIKTPEDVITKADASGVEKLVTLGTSVYHSREGLKLSRLFSGTLYCTAGVSPRGAVFWTDESAAQLEEVLESPQCLAVGPCGFDLSNDQLLTTCDQQLIAFEGQLQLAGRLGKPVIVTDNKATSEVMSLLSKYKPKLARVAVMSWPEEPEAFTSYLRQGFYYFISGEIHDDRPPSPLMRCLKNCFEPVWADQLLLASKSPNRAPSDASEKRDTGPDRLPGVVASLSKLLRYTEEELGSKLRRQAEQFYWGRWEVEDQKSTTDEIQLAERDKTDGFDRSESLTKHKDSLEREEDVQTVAGENGMGTNLTDTDDRLSRSRSGPRNDQASADWTYRIVLWLAFISGLLAMYCYDF